MYVLSIYMFLTTYLCMRMRILSKSANLLGSNKHDSNYDRCRKSMVCVKLRCVSNYDETGQRKANNW